MRLEALIKIPRNHAVKGKRPRLASFLFCLMNSRNLAEHFHPYMPVISQLLHTVSTSIVSVTWTAMFSPSRPSVADSENFAFYVNYTAWTFYCAGFVFAHERLSRSTAFCREKSFVLRLAHERFPSSAMRNRIFKSDFN